MAQNNHIILSNTEDNYEMIYSEYFNRYWSFLGTYADKIEQIMKSSESSLQKLKKLRFLVAKQEIDAWNFENIVAAPKCYTSRQLMIQFINELD